MAVMTHVPRPLLGLLVATVVFFALWIVALKPGSSDTSGSTGLGQYQSAINEAKASAKSQNRAAAAAGSTVVAKPAAVAAAKPAAAEPKPAAAAAVPKPAAVAPKPAPALTKAPTAHATATQRLNLVDRALATHKVLALLFYNPAASDDQAVKQELTTVPTSGGRVVKLAIPLAELANYPLVTTQVLIQSSPTLVIVDSARQAFTLVGFSSAFEITRRVGDALSMR
jgi:hypothetical protein